MKRVHADSPPALPLPIAAAPQHYQARLTLGFADDAGATRLVERAHFGPLRVQKPLYPEGPEICHAVVVHPPGGVVGGDTLALNVRLGAGAKALITTPGAAKWYKANGHVSRQQVQLEIAAGASLEWLPQETIFFREAHVQLDHHVALGADARYIGCDILCFGRTASGESFDAGRIEQRISIRRDGKLIWFEQGALSGGSSSMHSPSGLASKTVCATLIAVGKAVPGALMSIIRDDAAAIANKPGCFGASQIKSVFVARYLGDSSETAKQVMIRVWQALRPHYVDREAVVPRIWNT